MRTIAIAIALVLACQAYNPPSAPAGVGAEATAPYRTDVLAYVDYGATNQRNDPCHVTIDTNAGVRVVKGFLDIWTPSSLLVDAGVTLSASGTCPAVVASTWSGIPGDATDGTVVNQAIHHANIHYVEVKTDGRTAEGEVAAYLDDRRQKGYSVTDGFGPLTTIWRTGAQATTSITAIPANATTVLATDSGNNLGVGSSSNTNLGLAVDFVSGLSGDGSTEPAKRFYKYARPWRWSSNVSIAPSLLLAKSLTPATDSGYISGHTAEAWRDALGFAYLVPERFQEMLTRAMELGENRILSGYHSPLDVVSGRIQAIAVVTYNLYKNSVAASATARAQALSYLKAQTGSSTEAELFAFAHSAGVAEDRFADHDTNKKLFNHAMTFGFPQINDAAVEAVVPKGAEMLLQTRLPYLTAAQRRVVLKSTAHPSGYAVMDDEEGYGRLNLFAAADGYGSFEGDVEVFMNATEGGFSAVDRWKNNISGPGKLVKQGTGELHLTGSNSFSGGSVVQEGVLVAESSWALGTGEVYVAGGELAVAAEDGLAVSETLTLLEGASLRLDLTQSADSFPVVEVDGEAWIDGASLHITFPGGYQPQEGDNIKVLAATKVHGKFSEITVDGYSGKVKAVHKASGVLLRLRD